MRNDPFDELGVTRLINAAGTQTNLGGSLMPAEVVEAMASASRSFVDMHELHLAAGRRIAELIGAPAAHICGGASAGIALMACACMTGSDVSRIRRLPNTSGMKSVFAVQKPHRSPFDRALLLTGGTFLEVDPLEEELEKALQGGVVALFHTEAWFCPRGFVPLDKAAQLAHRFGVPVIVDAAAELPPVSNFTTFLDQGADLVTFSGGKAIQGPQGTGSIVGRPELVEACRLNDCPFASVGRSMKVSKEEVAGLVEAIKLYAAKDHAAEEKIWEERVYGMLEILRDVPLVEAARQMPRGMGQLIPHVVLGWDPQEVGWTYEDLVEALLRSEPAIAVQLVDPSDDEGTDFAFPEIRIHPHTLRDGEAAIVANKVRTLFESGGGG